MNNTVRTYASVNIWDNGYPSGGNYWTHYTGIDLSSGPYQNETDGDGIGDTSYLIDDNNQDKYPLMTPITPLYYELLEKYNDLLADYRNLNSTYHGLLDSYAKLLVDLEALNATYYNLLADQETLINELSTIRNLMYIFIGTTVVFIATTVYLAIRKPKITP
ncbi:MAG: hypothetical protein OEX77_01465 [Candidatus Bathyarchaeota archaeon]|nr:hypothetical protein [Candidatus Bathyarchaeota archaeon]MDH5732573.1 hypothetical protein [Candidatus Bathyarchaeota archaeon]